MRLLVPATGPAELLAERAQTIAVAESSAGGLISARLLVVPGASAYYRGGLVVYSPEGARATFASAAPPPKGTRGATEGFARWLAATAAAMLGADWGVAETGATGPTPNPYGDPPGHAWVAVASPGGAVEAENVLTGEADRAANMTAFADAALDLLQRRLSA